MSKISQSLKGQDGHLVFQLARHTSSRGNFVKFCSAVSESRKCENVTTDGRKFVCNARNSTREHVADVHLQEQGKRCKLRPMGKFKRKIYRISNEFSFHTMYYETSCVFYIPEPLARGYKTHNEFHNTSYGMKIHLRFFLSHELTRNEQITRWNRHFPRIWDGWRRSLLRFDNKFALCSVINTRRRSHFTKVEIKKHQEEHVLM